MSAGSAEFLAIAAHDPENVPLSFRVVFFAKSDEPNDFSQTYCLGSKSHVARAARLAAFAHAVWQVAWHRRLPSELRIQREDRWDNR
jgi:hypothetical protein